MIESDCKSLNSLNIIQPGGGSSHHSRQHSISSQLSGRLLNSLILVNIRPKIDDLIQLKKFSIFFFSCPTMFYLLSLLFNDL